MPKKGGKYNQYLEILAKHDIYEISIMIFSSQIARETIVEIYNILLIV